MDYFEEIYDHFIWRRGTIYFVNGKDSYVIQEWYQAGIPLPVVIEAIDSVFDKAAERKKFVSSIYYCKHAVKELWDERRELTVGEGSSTPEASPSEALEALASSLESVVVVSSFAPRVRALAAEKSVPRIEEKLIELERELIDSLLASLPAAERPVVALPPGVDEKTRAWTEEANLRRAIRERFGLPRLTLFR
jgi:hypothetical protein